MAAATFTKSGTKAATPVKLNPAVFGIKELNQELLHQAYTTYLANGRINLARTKTRGLVQGGGRKPWRQKGTGRARVGSRRTPIWRGGGIIFGPTGQENYAHKLNAKSKRAALVQALSALNTQGSVIVIEDFALKAPKTAELSKLLSKIGTEGYSLIAVDSVSEDLRRASKNLADVKVVQANYLNVARLLDCDTLIVTKPALALLDQWFAATTKKAEA